MESSVVYYRWSTYLVVPFPLFRSLLRDSSSLGVSRFKFADSRWKLFDLVFKDELSASGLNVLRRVSGSLLYGFYPVSSSYVFVRDVVVPSSVSVFPGKLYHRVKAYFPGVLVFEVFFVVSVRDPFHADMASVDRFFWGYVNSLNKGRIATGLLRRVNTSVSDTVSRVLAGSSLSRVRHGYWSIIVLSSNPGEYVTRSGSHVFHGFSPLKTPSLRNEYGDHLFFNGAQSSLLVMNSLFLRSKKLRRKFREHLYNVIDLVNGLYALFYTPGFVTRLGSTGLLVLRDLVGFQDDSLLREEWQVLFYQLFMNPFSLVQLSESSSSFLIPSRLSRWLASSLLSEFSLFSLFNRNVLPSLVKEEHLSPRALYHVLKNIVFSDSKDSLLDVLTASFKYRHPLTQAEATVFMEIIDQAASFFRKTMSHDYEMILRLAPGLQRSRVYQVLGSRKAKGVDAVLRQLVMKGLVYEEKVKGVGRPSADGYHVVYKPNYQNKLVLVLVLARVRHESHDFFASLFFDSASYGV